MSRLPIIRAAIAIALLVPVARGQVGTPAILYTLEGSQAGERLGWSLVAPGDLNGDGVPDILAGGPGDFINGTFPGIVRAYSGMDGSVLYTVAGQQNADGFGMALTVLPDLDGDGRPDFAVGAPYDDASGQDSGSVYVCSGASGALIRKINGGAAGDAFGWSLCNGRDFNSDGAPDLVVGAPLADAGQPDAGVVSVYEPVSGTLVTSANGPAPLAEFGYSVASAGGAFSSSLDVFIGAPGFSPSGGSGTVFRWVNLGSPILFYNPGAGFTTGLAMFGFSTSAGGTADRVAISYMQGSSGYGVNLFTRDSISHTAYSQELSLQAGSAAVFGYSADDSPYTVFGIADGGTPLPLLIRLQPFGAGYGAMGSGWVPSSQLPISRIWSMATMRFVNADPDPDLAIGDPTYGAQMADAGRVIVLLPLQNSAPPSSYCNSKVNSQGCTPHIGFSGAPTLSVADNFHVVATSVLNNKPGLMLWSLNQNNIPFAGGTLCLGPLFHRTAAQMSHGNPPPNDCSGSYDFYFSQAYMNAQALSAGVTVYCQFYSRDDGFPPPQSIGLTDAVRFTVLP